mgnify:CR=1 FL=1
METYNALIGTKVKEMTIQEMFNTAYDIASREGSCKVWNYDDDDADELIHCYKTSRGKIVTWKSKEKPKQMG